MIAILVIAQIVIAAEPRGMNEIAARAIDRRATHPGQHNTRLEITHGAGKVPGADEIERTAKRYLFHRQTDGTQPCRAARLAADDELLRLARMMQRDRQPLEESLRPTMRCAGHGLQDARHDISASKCCATSSAPRPFCRRSAASCCCRHSASSLSSAIACWAKLSSSGYDESGDAGLHPLCQRAQRLHHRRHAQRLSLSDGDAERLIVVAAIEHRAAFLQRR